MHGATIKIRKTLFSPHHIPKAEPLKYSVARIMTTRILSAAQNTVKIFYHCRPQCLRLQQMSSYFEATDNRVQ
jgi:hypothetical protein